MSEGGLSDDARLVLSRYDNTAFVRIALFMLLCAGTSAAACLAYFGFDQNESQTSIFDSRYTFSASAAFPVEVSPLRSFSRIPALAESLQDAKGRLTDGLRKSEAFPFDETRDPVTLATIPLPRSRPAQASLGLNQYGSNQRDDRTLLQKLGDLLPGRITLASLSPTDGLLASSSDLRTMGFDEFTAVYDISARTVYMPSGLKLEAHSGIGALKDDPARVNERNMGATPPALYDLTPRERAFHGVQAIRMTPRNKESILGRDGLLMHSYMLGPEGDSNGCVSIRDYGTFLSAFQRGEVTRLAVVKSLKDAANEADRTARVDGF